MKHLNNLDQLAISIYNTNQHFLDKAQKQENTSLTLRNWLIGFYIVEYEQSGKDRAEYGAKLYKALAKQLSQKELKSIRERHLYPCKQLYLTYPQILRM